MKLVLVPCLCKEMSFSAALFVNPDDLRELGTNNAWVCNLAFRIVGDTSITKGQVAMNSLTKFGLLDQPVKYWQEVDVVPITDPVPELQSVTLQVTQLYPVFRGSLTADELEWLLQHARTVVTDNLLNQGQILPTILAPVEGGTEKTCEMVVTSTYAPKWGHVYPKTVINLF